MYSVYSTDLGDIERWDSSVLRGEIAENGMKYVLIRSSGASDRFSAFLQVDSGATNEWEERLRGIAHGAEHLAFDNTVDYPGREALWLGIEKAGVPSFNAFTSFRSTVYMLLDASHAKTDEVFKLFYNQVQQMQPLEESLRLEKGAVLSEARFRNSSSYIALVKMLENHGGDGWLLAQRLPIGTQKTIREWTTADVNRFLDRWYRLDKMTLWVSSGFSGDEDMKAFEQKLKAFWSAKKRLPQQEAAVQPNIDLGTPTPQSSLILQHIDGMEGMEFNIMVTRPYQQRPTTFNGYRRLHNQQVFTIVYGFHVLSALMRQYPELPVEQIASKHLSGAAVQSIYEFNSTVALFALRNGEDAQKGSSWRADLGIAIGELKNLANDGPSKILTMALSYMVFAMNYLTLAEAQVDNSALLQVVFGEGDVNAPYAPNQLLSWGTQLLSYSFLDTATRDVKSEAEFIYRSIIEVTGASDEKLFPHVRHVGQVSGCLLVGRPTLQPSLPDPITIEDVKNAIHDAHEQDYPSRGGIEVLLGGYVTASQIGAQPAVAVQMPVSRGPVQPEKSPQQIQQDEKTRIEVHELANGIRVNIKQASADAPISLAGIALQVTSLGGSSTESPDVKGACAFVSQNLVTGYRYYYKQTADERPDVLLGNNLIPIECDSSFMQLRAVLPRTGFNWTQGVQQLYTALYPAYSLTDLERFKLRFEAAKQAEQEQFEEMPVYLAIDKLTQHAGEVMSSDHRFRPINTNDVKNLSPYKVTYWISSQWLPDRTEINVVTKSLDDVEKRALLRELNRWFGSIPSSPRQNTRIGYDIRDEATAASKFTNVKWPTLPVGDQLLVSRQELPSVAENRAFVGSLFSAPAPSSSVIDQWLMSELLSSYMFYKVRVMNGFSYFAIARLQQQWTMPLMSALAVVWAPGDYPPPQTSSDPLNVEASWDTVRRALFNETIEQKLFDGQLSLARVEVATRLGQAITWLDAVRGLSLRRVNSGETFVKIEDLNLVSRFNSVTYEQFKDLFKNWLQSGVSGMQGEVRVSIETVPISS